MKSAFTCMFAASMLFLAGCGQAACDGGDCGHDHGRGMQTIHPTKGPHHGRLVDLGNDEFHAELVFDETNETVTAFLLDDHALNAVGTEASEAKINLVHDGHAKQFTLSASPQMFDAPGETSRFESTNSETLHELVHLHGSAHLVVAIRGKQYRGNIESDHQHGDQKSILVK